MRRANIAVLLLAVLCCGAAPAASLPEVGVSVPKLVIFDQLMQDFMATHSIPAGALGIMKDGVVVFERSYGYMDSGRTLPIRPDVRMRVASLTKPVTAAAIRKLIGDGSLALTNRVFSLGTPGAGVLDYVPFGTIDPRLADITVENLLHHRGGWDRDTVGDWTYIERLIASDMGVANPPGRDNTVRWIMGKPLQADPGSTYKYSNIGFLLLGLIVEKVSGIDYLEFVHQRVFAGTGIVAGDLYLGRTFKADQDEREPDYKSVGTAWNVFYPDQSGAQFSPWPYGGWDHEARTGQGRIVASTRAYLVYLDRYMISGNAIGSPRQAPGTWRRNHTGSLNGTNALARQRGDGINYVVLFNQRPESGPSYASQMRIQIDQVLDAGTVSSWPTIDPANVPVPRATLTVSANQFSADSVSGRYYRMEVSTNMVDWTATVVTPWVGDNTVQTGWLHYSGTNRTEYLRIRVD